jgi:fructokinase
MPERAFKIVGLGEILWDLFPAGRQLGGAPSNFAYITTLLGNCGIVASRVGSEALGNDALAQLSRIGVTTEFVQRDDVHETGVVRVEVDSAGQPRFEIAEDVAWDFLEWNDAWKRLASEADAVCFGSLAQRCPTSRNTIRNFVRSTRPGAVRVFDVNLRQSFFTKETLTESMDLADVVKLNHEELPRIMDMLGLAHDDLCSSARRLLALHHLKLVCVTRGQGGSLIATSEQTMSEHPGFPVKVADTVGSGDAFTASLIHEYLRGRSIEEMNETANRVGAWVASQVGGMPVPPGGDLRAAVAGLKKFS